VDLDIATAAEIADGLRARSIASVEVLDHLTARTDRLNPGINAVVALDLERAYATAKAADSASARGELTGPLHGLPMTVKDVWETEGLVTTAGAQELKDYVPTTDALAVGRIKAAGGIIFGKTNTPLYAGDFQTFNDVYGLTSNPWDLSRTAGGSSGGSAAAVAAGLTPLELGSDIGGSVRNPAHYNGVYGLKPSWGVVPSRGHIPGPPGTLIETDVNANGPLARSIDDLGLALDVIAGPVPEDAVGWRLVLDEGPPVKDLRSLRVATVFDEGGDVVPVAHHVRSNLDAFVARIAEEGAHVDQVALPVPLADGRRQSQRAAWASLFERYDVVLAPVMPTAAFPHDIERPITERTVDVDGVTVSHIVAMAWCGAIGSVLLPVVTLPTGLTPEGLPVGIQVIGPFLSDRRLLRLAGLLDACGPGFTPPPV
jgi:amidase